MRLVETRTEPSPVYPDFVRLTATLEVESRATRLDFVFDFPADLEADLTTSGDPWAILMLPLACYFNERLFIDRPLDRVLIDNLNGLQQTWKTWYPSLHLVPIEATDIAHRDRRTAPATADRKTICCCSGGIDSLFAFYRHKDAVLGDGHYPIDELLCIGGLMTERSDLPTLRRDFEAFANRHGKRLVPMLIDWRYGDQGLKHPYSLNCGALWEEVSHGPAIAACIHLFKDRYKELIIPGSSGYLGLKPWGSHPLTDPLLSSSTLQVVHDGATFERAERTAFVARFDEALSVLHVCGQDRSLGNCSVCEKCLRTMAALDIAGAKDRAPTFDWSRYSMARLSRVWFTAEKSVLEGRTLYFQDLVTTALKQGRHDVAEAARASIRYSQRKYRVLTLIRSNPLTRWSWEAVRALRAILRKARTRAPTGPLQVKDA